MKLGYMVSASDFQETEVAGAYFTELLLFDGDLERLTKEEVHRIGSSVRSPLQFVLYEGRERLLDLASEDEPFRVRCVEVVPRTRELADILGGHPVIGKESKILSANGLLPKGERLVVGVNTTLFL